MDKTMNLIQNFGINQLKNMSMPSILTLDFNKTMTLNQYSWEELQAYLDIIRQTGHLSDCLDVLYAQQKATQYIRKDVLEFVKNIDPIKDENNRTVFTIQLNPPRAQRGVPANSNPNPVHMLPTKVPCFCCEENVKTQWPNERGFEVKINNKPYLFLANPAPLFDQHFNLVSKEHRPMEMDVELLATVSKLLPNTWVVQNGADAGASNPWHFHVQTFKADFPATSLKSVQSQYKLLSDGQLIKMEKLDYPFHLYRVNIKTLTPMAIQYLKQLQDDYLNLDPNNRLNISIYNKDQKSFEIYFSLRNTHAKTAKYSGTPAYAETLGFLTTPKKEDKESWQKQGIFYFYGLLKEINTPESIEKAFGEIVFK